MTPHEPQLAVVILAAGAGSRFSSKPAGKLSARLDGRPLLEHVLAAVRDYAPPVTVVVLGHGADQLEGAIDWRRERRVRNPAPERGLGSSLKVGMAALRADADRLDGAFIVLGDQPRLRAEVLRALGQAVATARSTGRTLVVPSYTADVGPPNPVLLLRPAWSLVDDLDDERGFGPMIEQRPDMVQTVRVSGSMPDVDTPADLDVLQQP